MSDKEIKKIYLIREHLKQAERYMWMACFKTGFWIMPAM
jgi:hypothetical protein